MSGAHVEAALVARAFETLALLFEIDGAGEVRALLPVGAVLAFRRADEDGRVGVGRVSEVERRAGRESFCPFDLRGRETLLAAGVERGLPGEACGGAKSAVEVSARKLQNSRRVTCASSPRS